LARFLRRRLKENREKYKEEYAYRTYDNEEADFILEEAIDTAGPQNGHSSEKS
jgi:hypothetical protein